MIINFKIVVKFAYIGAVRTGFKHSARRYVFGTHRVDCFCFWIVGQKAECPHYTNVNSFYRLTGTKGFKYQYTLQKENSLQTSY